jgi:DNA modification methylase
MNETFHRLVCGDSSSSPWIKDESVALVLTSPPYPMIEMWDSLFATRNIEVLHALEGFDGPTAFRMMHHDLDLVWSEVARVLKPGGLACVNIGDATRKVGDRFQLFSNHTRIIDSFMSLGFDILPLILWRKQTNAPNKFMGSGMFPAGAYVTLEHEYILIMRKGPKREFKSAQDKLVRQESAFFWEERNKWFSDIWDFKGTKQALDHPELRERSAAYPFELPYRLVNMYSVRGDTVFDPFLGTGTTIFAAMASGRNSIGVEIDPSFITTVAKECLAIKNLLNLPILNRIKDHHAFVEQCQFSGKELKYKNAQHGFPVMTSQEVNLHLECIENIQLIGQDQFKATYRDIESDLSREYASQDNQLTLAI